jgi:hypothetical protein
MSKISSVNMGSYYRCALLGLVKTVARAYDSVSGEPMIVYAPVGKNGYVDDLFLMAEDQFINTLKL